jgi:hypothetical protein
MNGSPAPSQFQCIIKHDYQLKECPITPVQSPFDPECGFKPSVIWAHPLFRRQASLLPRRHAAKLSLCLLSEHKIASFHSTQLATQMWAERFSQLWSSCWDKCFFHLELALFHNFDLGCNYSRNHRFYDNLIILEVYSTKYFNEIFILTYSSWVCLTPLPFFYFLLPLILAILHLFGGSYPNLLF